LNTERAFQIEYFYYGNLIQNGQPIGRPMVVGRTRAIGPNQAQECLQAVRVKPPDLHMTTRDMPSSIGVFRGGPLGFILLKAQRTADGFPQLLYMLIPEMAMRWLGGNGTHFVAIGFDEMPTFEKPRQDLDSLLLENPEPLDEATQIEFLYDLFYFCGDRIKNVEAILAALIYNQPIAILNAPLSLEVRMRFIQGLLSLLPAPARVGITWVTHTDHIRTTPSQVSFVGNTDDLDGYFLYDWGAGEVLTEPPSDPYSKFITSQLRLDASQVVETTTNIARTAVWRALRKDSLPQALHFASRRAAVDSAVSTNQPADREIVSAILRQDPTLSDEMRLMYAQHLLAMTLAMGDQLHYADVIPAVAAADRPVAEMAYRQLREVAQGNNPLQVIDLVERWLVNVPQASAIPWNKLAYTATLTYVERALQSGKIVEVINFLRRIQGMNRVLKMENAVPQLLHRITTAGINHPDLAMAVFLLGAEYLPIESFQKLITAPQLLQYLPTRLQQALLYLQPDPRPNPPRSLLMSVVMEFEAQQRMLIVGRLTELAVYLRREELIDTRLLEGLLRTIQSGYGRRFGSLLQYIAQRYTQPRMLHQLDQATLELLPNLYFSMGNYDVGVRLLEHYQANIYTIERLNDFTDTIGNIFLNATLSLEALHQIFALIEHSRIRPEPRARAYCAVMIAANWGRAYHSLARRLAIMLFNDVRLVDMIGVDHTLRLLAYHADLKDEVSVYEVGSVLLEVALLLGKRGVELVLKTWDHLNLPELAEARFDLLRRYVRRADASFAEHLPDYFGQKMGKPIAEALQATYVMRKLMAGRNFYDLGQALHITAQLLIDLAVPYTEDKEQPPRHRLKRGLDSMSGGLDDNERLVIGANLERIALAVYSLGYQLDRGKQTEEVQRALLRNEIPPETGGDFLIYIGGLFAKRKFMPVDLEREEMAHIFGNRSATMLQDEVAIAADLLDNLLAAFPPDNPPHLTLAAFANELDSLWRQISLYNQRQVYEMVSNDSQYIAQLVQMMASRVRSGDRVFKNTQLETGHKTPENEIEVLRWVAGYFNRTHRMQV
jgi:hypothetical protein